MRSFLYSWTHGESNPEFIHAMDVCYRYTMSPGTAPSIIPERSLNKKEPLGLTKHAHMRSSRLFVSQQLMLMATCERNSFIDISKLFT